MASNLNTAAANSLGFVFSISPGKKLAKKKLNCDDDEEYTLTLAPFTKAPKINFGQVKVNEVVERDILIINPQQFQLKLNVSNTELNIDNVQLNIDQGQNLNLKITWQPIKPDSYKYSILFEVVNAARLKFIVHAFGVCLKPELKKTTIRKPLTMLQPLKREKTTIFPENQTKKTENANPTSVKNLKENKVHSLAIVVNQPKKIELKSSKTPTMTKSKSSVNYKDMYKLDYDNFDECEYGPNQFDKTRVCQEIDRRQTCVIKTPKMTMYKSIETLTESNFEFNSISSRAYLKTPRRRSNSFSDSNNLSKCSIYEPNIYESTLLSGNYNNSPVRFGEMKKSSTFCKTDQKEDVSKTPKLADFLQSGVSNKSPKDNLKSNNYLYMSFEDEEMIFQIQSEKCVKEDCNYLKYVVMCQRAWRMKSFRKCLKELKSSLRSKRLNILLSSSKNLAKETQFINKKQEEFLLQQQLERQRIELKLIEMEKFEREKKERYLSCVIKCQRAFRMKMFRKYFQAYRNDLMLKVTLCVQRKWRLIKFRRCVRDIKMRIEYQNELVKYTIICQKSIRMKLFRKNLISLRQEKQYLTLINQKAALIQRTWRMYKFRSKMTEYRNSAIKIQTWYRTFVKQRLHFIALKTHTIKIQKLFREKQIQRNKSALAIQSFWKMSLERRKFNNQKNSALIIQKWFRSKTDRIRFLKLKRSISDIQLKCKELIRVRNKAASTIQMAYRLYKFRSNMLKFKTAAITIQTWTRSMKLRFEFLEKKRLIIEIQKLYKQVYLPKRNSSAIVIQNSWRCFKARQKLSQLKAIQFEKNRLNNYAIKIQSLWRGYTVRKHSNQSLKSIRNRLSYYKAIKAADSNNTLGNRIKHSLQILTYPCLPIQQIIMSLIDLDKVTRLSPECCITFTREGAIEILYNFILNCNRSVPHMDLIKFCLQIFINLSKYSRTVEYVLEPAGSLNILLNLLQAYQLTNPSIFMDVCIIFVLLSQDESVKNYIINQESFIKKLTGIYTVLKHKSTIRQKQNFLSTKEVATTSLASSNLNACSSSQQQNVVNVKKPQSLVLNLLPDWILTKAASCIEFSETLSALEYLINVLEIKIESEVASDSKTPIKKLNSALKLPNEKSIKKNLASQATTSRLALSYKAKQVKIQKDEPQLKETVITKSKIPMPSSSQMVKSSSFRDQLVCSTESSKTVSSNLTNA